MSMRRPPEHGYVEGTGEEAAVVTGDLKSTELRLGLPGTKSPEREADAVPMLDLLPSKHKKSSSGAKRGFAAAMIRSGSGTGDIHLNNGARKEVVSDSQEKKSPSPKAQALGWPPVRRSHWKNTMASNPPKSKDESKVDQGSGCLFVKVSMDGAPYLRKVDLKLCKNYKDLSVTLDKMFSCFTSDGPSATELTDPPSRSDFVLAYEDKDQDWMLVGDVPWEMFVESCSRLRIMKGSDATGPSPRGMEKSKNDS